MNDTSPFTSLAAVQAWDTWFRWRDCAGLHDTAIEDTWRRVTTALSVHEDPGWRQSLLEAIARWQLLPDESILAHAGTRRRTSRKHTWHAVVNVAACLGGAMRAPATIDLMALRKAAAMAARALDNAVSMAGVTRPPRLCIGLVGLADALALTGHAYDSDGARQQAVTVVRALAAGCWLPSATVMLGRRGTGRSSHAAVGGTREIMLTITPHPRLALLANEVADGIDPLAAPDHVHLIGDGAGAIRVPAAGYAAARLRARGVSVAELDTVASLAPGARERMRAALTPWLRRPIPAAVQAVDVAATSPRLSDAARGGHARIPSQPARKPD